jgi:hypothetical protein
MNDTYKKALTVYIASMKKANDVPDYLVRPKPFTMDQYPTILQPSIAMSTLPKTLTADDRTVQEVGATLPVTHESLPHVTRRALTYAKLPSYKKDMIMAKIPKPTVSTPLAASSPSALTSVIQYSGGAAAGAHIGTLLAGKKRRGLGALGGGVAGAGAVALARYLASRNKG